MPLIGEIPVISLWQPWASLVALGEKRIETRSWKWSGDLPMVVAIHAAAKWTPDLLAIAREEPFHAALALHGFEGGRRLGLPFGAVVGVVRIVECVSTLFLPARGDDRKLACETLAAKYLRSFPHERDFGDYGFGRYAWTFDRRLTLDEPIKMTGHQRIWRWRSPPKNVMDWSESVLFLET